jgi:hypothetical protein
MYVAPEWTVDFIRELPDRLTALHTIAEPGRNAEQIYIGTGGIGGVYRVVRGGASYLTTTKTIASGLGDDQKYCTCDVNRIAVRDLDCDGVDELIVETSQILPRGRPRLYVWELRNPPVLRGFARPEIESSWGHGLGFLQRAEGRPDHVISTYCGFGEVVEYQLTSTDSSDGFRHESVGWRQLGRLPASGEGVQLADADNDGVVEICLATGYKLHEAAIQIHSITEKSLSEQPDLVINEGGRFGTVKFMVGSLTDDGEQEMFVWWCSGLGDGETEFFRYTLGSEGIVSRTQVAAGTSDQLWPIDGQMTFADLNRDGSSEVWFATASGRLWRYDAASQPSTLDLICQITSGIGPITAGAGADRPCLYIGSGSNLLCVLPPQF